MQAGDAVIVKRMQRFSDGSGWSHLSPDAVDDGQHGDMAGIITGEPWPGIFCVEIDGRPVGLPFHARDLDQVR